MFIIESKQLFDQIGKFKFLEEINFFDCQFIDENLWNQINNAKLNNIFISTIKIDSKTNYG